MVVADLRRRGLHPCLEVLRLRPGAAELYASAGWQQVTTHRPPWLLGAVGEAGPDVAVMVLPPPR